MAPRAAKKRPAAKADNDAEAATGPSRKESTAAKPAAKKPRRQPAAAAAREEADSPSASSEAPNTSAGSEPHSEHDSGSEPESKPKARSKPAAKGAKSVAAARAGGGRNSGTGAKKAPAQGPEPREGAEDGSGRVKGDNSGGKTKAKAKRAEGTGGGPGAAARDPPGQRYFLMKSEPEEFSLDDLAARKDSTSHWEGVRNAQARNIMRSMRLGDEAFFYHSSCKVPAVVGLVRVVREAYPDHFAFDKGSKYYDPRSTPDSPKWWMVDVQLVRRLARPVTLAELRAEGARGPPIADMVLINKSRLSVQPVTEAQWERILELESAVGSGGQRGDEEDSE